MSELAHSIPITDETWAMISQSRQATVPPETSPSAEPLAGNVLPRLCQFAGAGVCKAVCQAGEGYPNDDKDCAASNGREVFASMGIDQEDVYLGVVSGSANVAFIDSIPSADIQRNPEGTKSFPATDAVFGYGDTVKACRLADCGMLVVSGKDWQGRPFDGFIHATRNNLNGDDQFSDAHGQPIGGVESMLRQVQAHYRPTEVSARLIAAITPDNYLWNFTPKPADLERNPDVTAEAKRESMFKDWQEHGWLRPHLDGGEWDGRYEADMLAAIRHQVDRAGLGEVYQEAIHFDGDPLTGHASNRAGKDGRIAEARDYYLVVPATYQTSER